MIDDADAKHLAHIAAEFAGRMHDDDPEATARWLCSVTDGVERWQLLFMLAGMVPTDQTPAQLLAWFVDMRQQAQARRIVAAMYPGEAA